jgi:hypothetical protein
VNPETITSKRVCEKGKNWCPFVLSLSKDERTRGWFDKLTMNGTF